MLRNISINVGVFVLTFIGLAFVLSNLPIKGRPLWCYLNKTITIKGGQAFYMTKELAELSSSDTTYLILGSSHAYRGYDPRWFSKHHIDVFNAGSSAQSLSSTLVLLKHYKSKFKRLILDVYPGSVCVNTDESTINLMQNSPDPRLAFAFVKSSLNIFTLNNYLYRILRLRESAFYNEEGYIGKGYVTSHDVLTGSVAAPDYHFDEKEWELLNTIVGYCVEQNIDLSLVSHPLPEPVGKNSGYWYFRQRMQQLSRSQGVPFYDYTYQNKLDSSYFKDHNHLNQKGVDLFNKQLIQDKFKIKPWN